MLLTGNVSRFWAAVHWFVDVAAVLVPPLAVIQHDCWLAWLGLGCLLWSLTKSPKTFQVTLTERVLPVWGVFLLLAFLVTLSPSVELQTRNVRMFENIHQELRGVNAQLVETRKAVDPVFKKYNDAFSDLTFNDDSVQPSDAVVF